MIILARQTIVELAVAMTTFVVLLFVLFFPLENGVPRDLLCGKPNVIPAAGRIVGGYDVGYYKYPWFVALTVDNEVGCGGTLVGPKTVLTAAHCFKPYFRSAIEGQTRLEDVYTIKLGMYNKCLSEPHQKQFRSAQVQLHENYYENMPYFDIALITLDEEATGFTPVCLPEAAPRNNTRGKEGTVQGFGRLDYDNETTPCTLQEARLLIYPDERCRLMLNSTENNGSALQHAFCAGYLDGKVDTCLGDSGGPFHILDKQGRYTQLGLTSFGFGCAQKDVLGIYTDVSHFIQWIYEKSEISNYTTISSEPHSKQPENVTYNFFDEIFPTTKHPDVWPLHPPHRRKRRPWRKRKHFCNMPYKSASKRRCKRASQLTNNS